MYTTKVEISKVDNSEEKVGMTCSQWKKSSAPAILDKKECQINVVKNWFSVQNITSEKEVPNEATEDIFRILKDILHENGLMENQIVAVTLLLADMDTFQDVNKVVYMLSKILLLTVGSRDLSCAEKKINAVTS
jgi:hypothetical protein